jgi:predicted outer membrane protein
MKMAALSLATACCLLAADAIAQPGQPGQPQPPPTPPTVGQGVQGVQQPGIQQPATQPFRSTQTLTRGVSSEADQFFAACLAIKNQGEVEISKFALERTQNPQVKQFAQQMIVDHQPMVPKLQQIAGLLAGGQFGADRSRTVQSANYDSQPGGARQPTTSQVQQAGGQLAGQTSALEQVTAIERQIAQRCGENLREKLQQKQGAEFDHCYIGSQIAAHMQMLAALEVLKAQTSDPLRQIAQEAEPKVKQHLETAEKLAEQLMQTSTRQAGVDRPGAVPRVPR